MLSKYPSKPGHPGRQFHASIFHPQPDLKRGRPFRRTGPQRAYRSFCFRSSRIKGHNRNDPLYFRTERTARIRFEINRRFHSLPEIRNCSLVHVSLKPHTRGHNETGVSGTLIEFSITDQNAVDNTIRRRRYLKISKSFLLLSQKVLRVIDSIQSDLLTLGK